MDDLKDIVLPPGAGLFEALIATCKRAKQIYDEETAKAKGKEKAEPSSQPPPPPKRRREGTAPLRIYCDDGAGPSSPPPRKKRRVPPSTAPNIIVRPPQPPVPECLRSLMEGETRERDAPPPEAKMVIQKCLSATDLSGGHNRLSIPFNKMAISDDDFLTGAEKEHLMGYEGGQKKYMNVTLFEPSLAPWPVKFTRWDMKKPGGAKASTSYVLNGSWKYVVPRNKLREGMEVQLWAFRVAGDLCFALLPL